MTSLNGSIFRVTVYLCGEFTGHRWIPPPPPPPPPPHTHTHTHTQRPVTRSLDVFFDLRLNKRLSKQWWGWWFETPSRHYDVTAMKYDVITKHSKAKCFKVRANLCNGWAAPLSGCLTKSVTALPKLLGIYPRFCFVILLVMYRVLLGFRTSAYRSTTVINCDNRYFLSFDLSLHYTSLPLSPYLGISIYD